MNRIDSTKLKAIVFLSSLAYQGVLTPFNKQLTFRFEYAEFLVWRFEQTNPIITKKEVFEGIYTLFDSSDDLDKLLDTVDKYINETGEIYDTNKN